MQGNSQLIFIVAIIGVFYFLVIRPQQKRVKAQREMLATLEPGSEIVTIGGIYATVVSVGERIRVALADGTEMEVAMQAVGQVLPPKAETMADVSGHDEAEDVPVGGDASEISSGADDSSEVAEPE